MKVYFIGLVLCFITAASFARGVYQTDEGFLAETFNNAVPKSKVLWVKGDLRHSIAEILGHNYLGLRIRYWQQDARTVWILEEIGKVKPITFGIVIVAGKVEKVVVLAFRESRGDEIRYPAFTRQFKQAQLEGNQLDRHIDGISGATLSVRAMTVVVQLALYLEQFTE
ncbi:MAG: FMN-binding protein [Piscirickettsiaceae bacterium]|nr:FMN-binding protein [Piscirickettsiaceae bacterium]